jgi:hypothetical protein
MQSLLTNTQLIWLDKLYEAYCNSQTAVAVPAGVFQTLKALGHVTGTAEAAHISSHGAGFIVQTRIAKIEQEREMKKTSKKKGKRSCSKNSSKNTNQETSNSPKFAW